MPEQHFAMCLASQLGVGGGFGWLLRGEVRILIEFVVGWWGQRGSRTALGLWGPFQKTFAFGIACVCLLSRFQRRGTSRST